MNLRTAGGNEASDAKDLNLKRAFDVCVRKARRNIKCLADNPRSGAWAEDGNYFAFAEGFFEIGNWTSSFFTGMALLAWQETKDKYFLDQTRRLAPLYREKVFTRHLDTHHDLGFLYTLYSVALFKVTGDPTDREVGLRAAEVLAQRFNERGGFIRAWGRIGTTEHDNMAIIDCLMNLPLLYWAAQENGNEGYREIARRHAEMVASCFVRADGSVVHAMRFDLQSGRVLGADNYCGYAKESYWARGASWAIYGFALIYRYSRDERHLQTAFKLATQFIAQLDEELVPVWDFRLPKGQPRVRDASAAAVTICGLQELALHGAADAEMCRASEALLERICRDDYLDSSETCPGVLKSAYGSKIAYSSWGDYFLMEALARRLFQFESWW